MNLAEALPQEIERNEELLEMYKSIGEAGFFGRAVISEKLDKARAAMSSQDVVAMLSIYRELKESE